jgi:hypothetical protein
VAVPIQVTFDCADPETLATFWAAVLDYKLQDPPFGFASWHEFLAAHGVPEEQWNSASAIVDPTGTGPRMFFKRVPEMKTVKNRVHLDVNVGGPSSTPREKRRERVNVTAERLLALGATKVHSFEQQDEYWVVMHDPEGNEFCLQ